MTTDLSVVRKDVRVRLSHTFRSVFTSSITLTVGMISTPRVEDEAKIVAGRVDTRIKSTYALGLITELEFSECEIILCRIRNVYILGFGFLVDADIPVLKDFLYAMQDSLIQLLGLIVATELATKKVYVE